MKAFKVWTFGGTRFLAFPNSPDSLGTVHVTDENGNNYGAWTSVEQCRMCQFGKMDFPFTPLGKMALSGRIVEESGR